MPASSSIYKESLEPWPVDITDKIKQWLQPLETDLNLDSDPTSPTADCEWLNLLLFRYFLSLRSSTLFRQNWAQEVSEKVNPKLAGNAFIVCTFYLG